MPVSSASIAPRSVTTHMSTGPCGHDCPSHTHEEEDWILSDRPEHPEEACGVFGVYAPAKMSLG